MCLCSPDCSLDVQTEVLAGLLKMTVENVAPLPSARSPSHTGGRAGDHRQHSHITCPHWLAHSEDWGHLGPRLAQSSQLGLYLLRGEIVTERTVGVTGAPVTQVWTGLQSLIVHSGGTAGWEEDLGGSWEGPGGAAEVGLTRQSEGEHTGSPPAIVRRAEILTPTSAVHNTFENFTSQLNSTTNY